MYGKQIPAPAILHMQNQEEEQEMAILDVQHVQKIYTTRFGGSRVQALRDVSFQVERG